MNTDQTRDQLADLIDDGSCAEAADHTASTILDKFVVIPSADLPEVVEDGGELRVEGYFFFDGFTASKHRRIALRNLAIAEYLDAKEAREAEQELATRRDELANELYRQAGFWGFGGFNGYADLNPVPKAAVNMLIEAQDKLAKYEETQA